MLEFKKIRIEDFEIFKKYIRSENELSCENSFANLFLWHGDTANYYAIHGDSLIIRTQDGEKILYRFPLGGDFCSAMEELREYCSGKLPDFYGYDGETFNKFLASYSDEFQIYECRDEAEYIYPTNNLIELSGKKFHSKRNHISAFSKKFDWHYEKIDSSNIEKVNACAKKWYQLNLAKGDSTLSIDRDESRLLIENMKTLDLLGGAVFVDDEVVAYTIGTALNSKVFDIMVEKALPQFATAYSVINREFARNELSSFEYINREDDMGLDGLRKAKLSYKPEILLKKYYCYYKRKA